MNIIPDSFYKKSTLELAEALLGNHLVRTFSDSTRIIVRITETEAYREDGDQASHSYRGRTDRNEAMFGNPGTLYVYLIYGVHNCFNIVTEQAGTGAAVLIRAAEAVEGMEQIIKNRNHAAALLDGPGKLSMALKIDRSMNFHKLNEEPLQLCSGSLLPGEFIQTSTRIGISRSTELPWRFQLIKVK